MKPQQQVKGYYSDSYKEARVRFVKAASDLKAEIYTYKLDTVPNEDLTMDVAILGNDADPVLVISSGVHGVEGFFGSAVQLAWLEKLKRTNDLEGIRYIFIHAVNPYGFAHIRRVNEDNIDPNRNFLPGPHDYSGAPETYSLVADFLNPDKAPHRTEPFYLKAVMNIFRHGGLQPLKNAIAGGQYEYPEGLFFGGKGPSWSAQIIQEHYDAWLADSSKVLHIDLHTGLGSSGTYKLLLSEPVGVSRKRMKWYSKAFGKRKVELLHKGKGTAYNASGALGDWMLQHFKDRNYRFVAAEFGTHFILRVLKTMRIENTIHHHGGVSEKYKQRVKKEMLECFYPAAPRWRRTMLHSGLMIIEQGIAALKRL